MRVITQRVREAHVRIDGEITGRIGAGQLVLLGIEPSDGPADIDWLVGKLTRLRIFSDAEDKMNWSIQDIEGGFLVISQFTLFASTKKGNRPGYIRAARPEQAIPLYEEFLRRLAAESGRPVESGSFGADMQVSLVNDGPVTIFIDSRARE